METQKPSAVKKRAEIELTIDALAYGGAGVGRLDNFVVFVPHALPGDRVRAYVYKKKKSFAQARLTAVLEPSPQRIKPRCRHFTVCGGCAWQNLAYENQLKAKEAQVRECLEKLGGFENPPLRPIVACHSEWNYRNKMEFTFGKNKEGEIILGLLQPGFFNRVVDLNECHLPGEDTFAILDFVRKFARNHKLEPYDKKLHAGFLRNLIVRSGADGTEYMVCLVTTDEPFKKLPSLANQITHDIPSIKSFIHAIHTGLSDTAVGQSEKLVCGEERLEETILGFKFQISAKSFMQSNARQSEELYRIAIDSLDLQKSETVLDLYCGIGTITLALSQKAGRVIGIESSADAIADAIDNAERNGVDNVEFAEGPAEKLLPDVFEVEKPQAILLDPPRSGMHPKALKALMEIRVPRMAYVSCNPSTLARDLQSLVSVGYAVDFVQPVDMFPQTSHIECVARLTLKGDA